MRAGAGGRPSVLELRINPRQALATVTGLAGLSFITSLVLRLLYVNGHLTSFGFTINEVLNVDAERNPPTWLQASLMLACGGLAWIVSQRTGNRGWRLIALFLVAISADEAGRLHENLIGPAQDLFGTEGTFLHYAWVIPAVPAFALFLYLVRSALAVVTERDRARLTVATCAFLLGSVGVEMISGLEVESGVDTTAYVLLTHIEEGLEFAGLLGVFAVLLDMARRDGRLRLVGRDGQGPTRAVTDRS